MMNPTWATTIALLFGLTHLVTADTHCDASTPCSLGCCGPNNVCGFGPDYCSTKNCLNSCDAKAECNPAGWPSQYANASGCPLNVCCSQFGFCGTTADFCGANATVARPSCDAAEQEIKRVIGYYASGGVTRSCGRMVPQAFPQGVYSHVYFSFGSINPDTFKVIPAEGADEDLYPQLAALKTRDLGQEFWLSIGGWTFSDSGQPTATTFSDLVNADLARQNVFFASLTLFMHTWGFTGVDIDWEYPVASDRNGRDSDYAAYPAFLKRLRAALDEYKFGLSVTIPTSYWYLHNFDLVAMEASVDWFNIMTYDLHGTWDFSSDPSLNAHTNLTAIEDALDLLWRNNITTSKVNMGMAFYGRSFTLASADCAEPGCAYLSAGDAGQCSDTPGILLNSEIQQIIRKNGLKPTLYEDAAVKVVSWGDSQWVAYDDEDSWKLKADFAKSQCLGGVFVWAVDYDDEQHSFSNGLASALGNDVNVDSATGLTVSVAEKTTSGARNAQDQYCRFANCGESCPAGFTEVKSGDDKTQFVLDSTCPPGADQTQKLCCPKTSAAPTCQWRGYHSSGTCKGGCASGEAELGTSSAGCRSGYQSACCETTASTQPYSQCQWTASCESDKTCPSSHAHFIVGSRDASGGRKSCKAGQTYNYCCASPPDAFTNCAWAGHEVPFSNTAYCTAACPAGTVRVAEQTIATLFGADKTAHTAGCSYGAEAYCCSGAAADKNSSTSAVTTYKDRTAEEFDAYLQKFLKSPVCPKTWDAEYSATDDIYARHLLEGRATDQTKTLAILLPMLATWATSQHPRQDLTAIWESRLSEHGLSSAANLSALDDALYQDTWSGSPLYTPTALVADMLCNLAKSAAGVRSLAAASESLCEAITSSSERYLSARRLTSTNTADRSVNNIEPTLTYALEGVLNGNLSLHYLRWLNGADTTSVLLEAAFWIGSSPGRSPGKTARARYGDKSHTAAADRWVVMHLHIPLDEGTFRGSSGGWYPGVSSVSVYHSQGIHRPSAVSTNVTAEYRAEYRYSTTYAAGDPTSPNNQKTKLTDYNTRTQPLSCAASTSRWYMGYNYSKQISRLQSQPTSYAKLINRFGLWLHAQGAFSATNLARIWPVIATTSAPPTPAQFDGLREFSPRREAFDTNWLPDGKKVEDLSKAES